MLVCDDKGVVVPFHLLAKVIKMHHLVRHDFSLKITFEDKSEGAELTKAIIRKTKFALIFGTQYFIIYFRFYFIELTSSFDGKTLEAHSY